MSDHTQPDDHDLDLGDYGLSLDAEFDALPQTAPTRINNIAPLFPLPPSTPETTRLNPDSTQFRQHNFEPHKRYFRRVASPQEGDADLEYIRNKVWKHPEWRWPQLEVCRAAMNGCDILVVAPTGLGKSMCFQLPALTLEFGVTIVVCPLLALMGEQVKKLQDRGVKAVMLSSSCTTAEKQYIWNQLKMGHPEIRLLYTTPESLFSHNNADAFQTAYRQGQVARLVIDEAHVVDEWGVSFRPGYRELSKFRQQNPDIAITALTASATAEVRADILNVLGITRKRLFQRVLPVNRSNLFYEIRYRGPEYPSSKVRCDLIANIINQYKPQAKERNDQSGFSPNAVTGLVYCRNRSTCEEVAAALRTHGLRARAFHAGILKDEKDQLLKDWLDGVVECVVATIAFGMGVDHPHVRYVIHNDMPKSFEGRAGRDQKMSRCILLYSREDAQRQRNLVQNEAERAAKRLIAGMAESGMDEASIHQNKQRAIDSFKLLQHFAESTICRHLQICRYFGEEVDEDDPEAVLENCEKMCDICCKRGTVLRRAQVLTENIEIASQVIRPKVAIKIQPPTSTVPSSAGVPNSLAMLHGNVSEMGSDPPEVVDPRPKKRMRVGGDNKGQTGTKEAEVVGRGAVARDRPIVQKGARKDTVEPEQGEAASVIDAVQKRKEKASGLNKDMTESKRDSRRTKSPEIEQDVEPGRTQFGRNATPGPAHKTFFRQTRPDNRTIEEDSFLSVYRKSTDSPSTPARGRVPPRSNAKLHTPTKPVHARSAQTPLSARRPGTIDDYAPGDDGGGYAVAETLPLDPKKRVEQVKKFMAIESVKGKGPFGYYQNGAAVNISQKRAVGVFKTPFNVPLPRETSQQVGEVSVEDRKGGMQTLQRELKKTFLEGEVCDRIWGWWGREEVGEARAKGLKRIGKELEGDIVQDARGLFGYKEMIGEWVAAIRTLRAVESVHVVTSGELERDFTEDEMGKKWIRLKRVVRGLKLD